MQEDKSVNALLSSIHHFIIDSLIWDFVTIQCHECGETFIACVAGPVKFCPKCGAALVVRRAKSVTHPAYRLEQLESVDENRMLRELETKRDG